MRGSYLSAQPYRLLNGVDEWIQEVTEQRAIDAEPLGIWSYYANGGLAHLRPTSKSKLYGAPLTDANRSCTASSPFLDPRRNGTSRPGAARSGCRSGSRHPSSFVCPVRRRTATVTRRTCLSLAEVRPMYSTLVALLLLSSCGPSVLSPFGDVNSVSPNRDGSPRPRERAHDGVDFGPASKGDDVIASADGTVAGISEDKDYGIEIRIVHDGVALDHDSKGARYITSYLHLEKASVRAGQRVMRGEKIGEVGLFWGSGGVVHVHWRLCRGDCSETLNPIPKTTGCYKAGATYPAAQLVLTYPLRC